MTKVIDEKTATELIHDLLSYQGAEDFQKTLRELMDVYFLNTQNEEEIKNKEDVSDTYSDFRVMMQFFEGLKKVELQTA